MNICVILQSYFRNNRRTGLIVMELSKVTKLLRLMQLLSTNTGYSIDGLMEKTGLSRRNIYNYLDTFRQAGFAVMKTGATGNTYRLVPSSNTPDLAHITYFTEEEAAFLNMLTDSLGIGDGNAISERVKHKLASIYKYVPAIDNKEDRTRKKKDADIFAVTDNPSTQNRRPYRIKLLLDNSAKKALIEHYPLSRNGLRVDRGRWIWEGRTSNLEGVGRFVLSLTGHIQVLSDENLKRFLRNKADFLMRKYDNPPK